MTDPTEKTFILPDAFEAALAKMTYGELEQARARIEDRQEELRHDIAMTAQAMGMSCSLNGAAKPRRRRAHKDD